MEALNTGLLIDTPNISNIEYIDLNLHEGEPHENIIVNPLHLFFQEIELAIQIAPGEIWGVKDGINLSRYLFNRYVTITQIRNEIKNYINKNCQHSSAFSYNITVETIKSSQSSDLIYITVTVNTVNTDSNVYGDTEFIQKFLLGA